jgi:PAS domain S-box-containing protein
LSLEHLAGIVGQTDEYPPRTVAVHGQRESGADNMVAVVTRWSRDFQYVWVTQSYAAWVGRPPEEIAGRLLPDVIGSHGFDRIRPYITQVLSGRKVEHISRVNLLGRGYRWIREEYMPIYSHGADVDGWISTVIDVTESKRIELERNEKQIPARTFASAAPLRRRKAESLRGIRELSMDEVGPSIAHEVNQPLAAVLTNAEAGLQWLSGETPNIQQAKASLAMIVRDGERASAIIKGIHELLKKERGDLASLDMNEILEDAVAPVRAEFPRHATALRIECCAALPPVWGDRIQLEQVIFNLARNGVEAMASVEGSKELVVTCRRSPEGDVLVAVRDSGAGIDAGDLERIFHPFFTTKSAGMGIGLSISRSIIEAHGGRIWAERNEGPGLTVQFSLPAAAPNRELRRKQPGAVNRVRNQPVSRTH